MRVVAFGGGHGLGASLRALRRCRPELPLEITAVVTVGDNGGSSGRLRRQRGALPPGDLRQALVALAPDQPPGAVTAALFQHRFAPVTAGAAGTHHGRTAAVMAPGAGGVGMSGQVAPAGGRTGAEPAGDRTAGVVAPGAGDDPLAGHAVGNLLLCGLVELLGDPVAALAHAAGMLGSTGQVLPMCREPVALEARIRGADPDHPGELATVRGQHEVAVSAGRVESVRLDPAHPAACPEAVAAVATADWLVFGPGSWYTSVIPHLLVPDLAAAVLASRARRLVILNLAVEPETAGLTVPEHLTALPTYASGFTADVVLGDVDWVADPEPVRHAAGVLGARLVLGRVARDGQQPRHDPAALAKALLPVLAAGR